MLKGYKLLYKKKMWQVCNLEQKGVFLSRFIVPLTED